MIVRKAVDEKGLSVHRDMFKTERNKVTHLMKESKSEHLTSFVHNAKGQKELFQVTNKILYKNKCIKLPSTTSDVEHADLSLHMFLVRKLQT